MKRSMLLSIFATSLLGALGGMMIFNHANVTVHAQGQSQFAPGQQSTAPSAVGNWFGIARPCPATGDDAGHAAFCQAVCGTCASIPGSLPSEVPMMPMIHADGTVTVNDAASTLVFHTTAQGVWAPDPDATQPQFAGKTRLQASFIWLQGDGQTPGHFVGVARPRFVTYWDPTNPDNMIGYIQPHFTPTNGGPPTPFPYSPNMYVVPSPNFKGNLDVTNHYPAFDFLAKLPSGCQTDKGCLGTYHFAIHRVKANVPN
jgi:hypothetical protein